jgi:hypothetical protein
VGAQLLAVDEIADDIAPGICCWTYYCSRAGERKRERADRIGNQERASQAKAAGKSSSPLLSFQSTVAAICQKDEMREGEREREREREREIERERCSTLFERD